MWHGPALADLLEDVSASDAAAHPIRGAHSIWELVLHVTAWTEIARERLAGSAKADPTPEEDWPPVKDTSADAWRATRQRLKDAHRELADEVAGLDDATLVSRLPGKDHTAIVMYHGIIEHDAYHGGQIALLKKAIANGQ
jgi:uncharacterized damage-inducible protein DinB